MEKNILQFVIALFFITGLVSCAANSTPTSTRLSQTTQSPNRTVATTHVASIWDRLQLVSTANLKEMRINSVDPTEEGWIDLVILTKQKNISTQKLANELMTWRQQYPSHPGNQLFPDNATLSQLEFLSTPKHIAILLPQSGPYASSALKIKEGFLNAYQANAGKQTIKFYDTAKTQDIKSLHQQAIVEGADFVIGPLVKENVQQLSTDLSSTVPTLALNYTNQSAKPSNLYEFGLLPEDEASQLADRAYEAGRKQAIIIAPQNAWGDRMTTALAARWKAKGGEIRADWHYGDKLTFNEDVARLLQVNLQADKRLMKENNNKEALVMQRRQDFDVIFLFAQPREARLIVPLLRYYYAGNVPVYATSATYSKAYSAERDSDLNGVIVCDIPWKIKGARMASTAGSSDRLYAVGQDAYMLSQSLQRLQNLPHFPLYGTTGALRLSSKQQIHRRLPCAAIRNGRV